jgi:aminoglycoside 6'-N-acetyltransferase I
VRANARWSDVRNCRKIVSVATSNIRPARAGDEDRLLEMHSLLWPDTPLADLREETLAGINQSSAGTLPTTMLVAEDEAGALTGFVAAGLRSHADGCNPERPVGFVEGWFVREPFRGQGIGAALIRAAEDWARAQGCREMASDALVDNQPSLDAHRALGFEVVDRCVHFRKDL